jgi:hypothetical protein
MAEEGGGNAEFVIPRRECRLQDGSALSSERELKMDCPAFGLEPEEAAVKRRHRESRDA